jgi:phosphatidate cytidylyltransferase
MLTRIISAAVGIVILAAVLVFHNTVVLPAAVAVIIMLMVYELLKAAGCDKLPTLLIPAILYGASVPLMYNTTAEKYGICVEIAAVFIVFATFIFRHKEVSYQQTAFTLAAMLLVPQAMTTMVKIDRENPQHGLFLLILGLCGAWIADTGAYFVGTFCGKHKLCPEISPKKTVEGFVGGIVITGILFDVIAALYANVITDDPVEVNYILFAVAGMVCAVIGTVGDLSASMIKRQCGIKDYGKIMPGHGGMMDRFDSVLFVLPTFYAFVSLAGIVK